MQLYRNFRVPLRLISKTLAYKFEPQDNMFHVVVYVSRLPMLTACGGSGVFVEAPTASFATTERPTSAREYFRQLTCFHTITMRLLICNIFSFNIILPLQRTCMIIKAYCIQCV